MNSVRAKRLIEQGIRMLVARGWGLAPPEAGQYLTMGIMLVNGGPRFRLTGAKLTPEQLFDLSGGKLTPESITVPLTRSDHVPVFSVVIDGEDVYSEVTELRVDVRRVGGERPFQARQEGWGESRTADRAKS